MNNALALLEITHVSVEALCRREIMSFYIGDDSLDLHGQNLPARKIYPSGNPPHR